MSRAGPDILSADEVIAMLALQPHREGGWTLVGCTVAPGFTFDGFELAGADFDPTARA